MSKNYVQPGEVIDYTNSSSDIAAGDLIDIGDRAGVALVDIPKNATGSVAVSGVFDVPASLGAAVSQGTAVKTNGGGKIVDSSGTTAAGYAFKDAAKGADTIRLALNA